MAKISVVVLIKNEEKNIERCLRSLVWADELILIDDGSDDKTIGIAKKFGAKVYHHPLENNFANQRNFGLSKALNDWVFFVDADEEVPIELKSEILREVSNNKEVRGFYLKRKDSFFGKWLNFGETAGIQLLRLGKRGEGNWRRGVDEVWEIKGETKTLTSPLLHYPHPTLKEYLESINERSTLNAEIFYNERKRITLLEWLKPGAKFFQNYFIKLGFFDGVPGFLVAVFMSFHSFLVRGKLYLLWRKKSGGQ